MLTPNERAALIEQFRQLPSLLAELVRPLSATQLTTVYLAGEWTVAQNVHHLADSHMNSYVRCKLIATEERPMLKPYDQERWAELPDASAAHVEPSLELLAQLHVRWVIFWETLSPESWSRAGVHPEAGIVTLEDQLRTYAQHGEAHLDQIRRTLAAGGQLLGAQGLYRFDSI